MSATINYSESIIPAIHEVSRNNPDIRENIEGTCEKYVIPHAARPDEYVKFCPFKDVFAEVFSSYILNQIGIPCVSYSFAVEQVDGTQKIGTISQDYSEGSAYRVTLASMAEKVGMIDTSNDFDYIYIDLPKTMKIIDTFCKMTYITLDKEEKKHMQSDLETDIVADFSLCNGDHHLKNTEFLVYLENGKKRIRLAPMFDLGQSLRQGARMAFTFDDLSVKGAELIRQGYSVSQMYAKHILTYFKANNKTSEELASNHAFRLLCYFLDYDFSDEMYDFVNTINKQHKHTKRKTISNENYQPIISTILSEIKGKVSMQQSYIPWETMKNAFEERQEIIFEEFCADPFFKDAYELIEPIKKLDYPEEIPQKYYY